MDREMRQLRTAATQFETREAEDGKLHITGYFARFGDTFQIASDMSESIAPGAFKRTLVENPDVRALVNHDTTLVLGRTKAGTLALREDELGLFGDIEINPNDQDAMNLYERVKRGDVDQCSFGFDIRAEDTEVSADGKYHWTLTDVDLYEVSACTFPAYQATSISAREAQRDEMKKRALDAWKEKMKGVLNNGT
jgi:HK97 family phage prohead protease